VDLYATNHKLHDASRLNYADPYKVEHNVKVWFIGKVTKRSEQQLIEDFSLTTNNEFNSTRKRDVYESVEETSGGYHHQKQGGLGEIYRPKNGAGYVQVTAEGG
jgi:hypothetical protein